MKTIAASTALLFVLALVTALGARGQEELIDDGAAVPGRSVTFDEQLLGTILRIAPSVPYERAVLRIAGPRGYALTKRFAAAEPIDADLLLEAETPRELASGSAPETRFSEATARAALPDGRYVYEVVFHDEAAAPPTHVGRFSVDRGTATASGPAKETSAPPREDAGPSSIESIAAPAFTEADFIKIDDAANDGTTFLTLDSDASDGGPLETWGLFNRFGDFTIEECGDGSNLGSCPHVRISVRDDTSNPRVGIGTAAPQTGLHLVFPAFDQGIRLTSAAGDYQLMVFQNSDQLAIRDQKTLVHPFIIQANTPQASLLLAKNHVAVNNQLQVNGSAVIAGDVALGSSRTIKHAIEPLDGTEVLEGIRDLPLYRWKYEADPVQALHVGPMAEDVYAAFRLGRDDEHLSPADSAGLALAAVQGLDGELQNLRQSNRELVERNRGLLERVETLERLVAVLSTPEGRPEDPEPVD